MKNKKRFIVLSAVGVSVLAGVSFADVNPELATKSGCVACHTQGQRLIGPSYNEIYEKYKADGNAVSILVDRVTKGSSGVWGSIPMTPNAHVPKEDIETIVLEILKKK